MCRPPRHWSSGCATRSSPATSSGRPPRNGRCASQRAHRRPTCSRSGWSTAAWMSTAPPSPRRSRGRSSSTTAPTTGRKACAASRSAGIRCGEGSEPRRTLVNPDDREPGRPIAVDRRISSAQATALVFVTSAAVLVLEILAGRLLAPYVGISLETFTGSSGTMLAGIAAGAWAGGALADTRDPAPLVGPTIALGGALSWLSLPIVDTLGPELGAGPGAIIVLTASAFFAPAAVLTAASPMIAKLRLH